MNADRSPSRFSLSGSADCQHDEWTLNLLTTDHKLVAKAAC
jgi:hypothetical protein